MFRWGEFTSHAGLTLPFKIEFDELSEADWDCLARMVRAEFSFNTVEGVPTGGLRFATALQRLVAPPNPVLPSNLLIVDDVFTTGASMERQRAGRDAFGVVVFARAKTPKWIVPMFKLGKEWRVQ